MMMFLTKKWLIATVILSAGLLFSCISDPLVPDGEEPTPPTKGEEIGFRSLAEKTRATEINNLNIADFRTWATWVRDANRNDFVRDFMTGVEVKKQYNNAWTYSPVRYWPAAGHMDFFGYSPANSSGASSVNISHSTTGVVGGSWIDEGDYRKSPRVINNYELARERIRFTTTVPNTVITFELICHANSYMIIGKPNTANTSITYNYYYDYVYGYSGSGSTSVPALKEVSVTFPNAGVNFIEFAYHRYNNSPPRPYPDGDYGMYKVVSGLSEWETIAIPSYMSTVSMNYDVTTDLTTQEDFMVATEFEQTSGPVVMNFEHILSQVVFKVRSAVQGVTFRLRSLELHNLDRTGTLTGECFPGSETQWTWTNNTYDGEKTVSYRILREEEDNYVESTCTGAPTPSNPAYVQLVNNLMLLPQAVTIGNNVRYTQAEIDASRTDAIVQGMLGQPKDFGTAFYITARIDSWTNYYGTGVGQLIPFHVDAPLYIPLYTSLGADGVVGGTGDNADVPFAFEIGKKYTFMLDLNDLNQVRFTVACDEWEEWIEVPIDGL